jgi:HEAT repeat protein
MSLLRTLLPTVALLSAVVIPARGDSFLGKGVAAWQKELTDAKPAVRRAAAFALGKCGDSGAVPNLVRALGDADAGVREAAAYAIGEIAAERKDPALWNWSGKVLRKMVAEETDAKARRSAACAVGQFGPDAAEARDELVKAITAGEAGVRQNVAWSLGRLKDKAGESGVLALAKALGDEDAAVRRDAAAALGEIGRPAANPAVRTLIACVAHETASEVRPVAVASLVALAGPEDKELAADLRGLLGVKDREVRRGVALALAKVGGDEAKAAVPVLVEALHDDDAAVRELAASALAHAGEAAGDAVPDLGKALSDRSEGVRRNAALALSRVGPRAGEAVRPLLRALDPEQPDKVRDYAAEALSRSEEAVNKALPELLAVLRNDRNPRVRQHIVVGMQYVPDFDKSGVAKELEKLLEEKDEVSLVARFNAACVMAQKQRDKASPKVVAVLEAMLNETRLREYKGTDPSLNKGNEATRSETGAKMNLGADARFMAARALAVIGASGKRDDALKVLRRAADSTDPVKKKVAADALKELGER